MTAPSISPYSRLADIDPKKLATIQAGFSSDWHDIHTALSQGSLDKPSDPRFAADAWGSHPHYLLMAHAYLLCVRVMNEMVEAADVSEDERRRLKFSVMQWLDAVAPSNFLATNPDAQRAILDSHGRSLFSGFQNLLNDLQKRQLSHTDESKFEVGKNLAITEGQVIYENSLFQLIQYAPTTPSVYRTPLLMVPPCINKFYILDLQPHNSFVRHAVDEGFTVFMMSWRNPGLFDNDGIKTATWANYIEDGVLKAIDVVTDVSGQKQINALGFCVGGTLLASALALAQARGKQPVQSLTLLTTMLDFSDTGVLDVFVDEEHVRMREMQIGNGGLMPARELGTTFAFLRPNELVWNYVVNNYLKGEALPAFDLLFWNGDGTNIPGPFFTWYFRNTYLENNLKEPGRVRINDDVLDFGSLTMPVYLYGSREDHIVPWQSAYASTKLLSGTQRFVLGASGHIAGVINPPARKRRNYWTCPDTQTSGQALSPHEWFQAATRHEGSWWPDWCSWLVTHSGAKKRAARRLGNTKHKVIEPAPGRYVKVRA